MKDIKSFKLDRFPLNLNFVMDLIYFDGPLLTLFKNENGDSYLYYWCDVDENYNRWMIFRLSKAILKSYVFKKLSLNGLILNPIDGFVYIVDVDNNLQYNNVCLIQPDKLPERYIPEGDSFYDFESELDEDGKLLILDHIFDDKELINILSKLVAKYKSALKDVEKKLIDILFGIYQKETTIKKQTFGGYIIPELQLPGAYLENYDNLLSSDSLSLIAINE